MIADDGTVLEPYRRAAPVASCRWWSGAAPRRAPRNSSRCSTAIPALRDQVRASVLVGERRWNLRLKNGIDVRLPETDIAQALERLVALDREKNLITRDIVAIDLRLPDRVTVRLSEAAAQARAEALKDKKPKKKGGDA